MSVERWKKIPLWSAIWSSEVYLKHIYHDPLSSSRNQDIIVEQMSSWIHEVWVWNYLDRDDDWFVDIKSRRLELIWPLIEQVPNI